MASTQPRIQIFINPKKDISCFDFFLANTQYKSKRSAILTFYPKLREQIQLGENAKTAVRDLVLDMYRRFNHQIQDIVSVAKMDFSLARSAFEALARYMAYPELSKHAYTAVPTFLPFSPLGNNLFYFSIASAIANRKTIPLSIAAIGVHEISHFIFSAQYATLTQKTGVVLNDPTFHFLKEALTAAIMNQNEFREFFDYPSMFHSEFYPGNAELHHISIEHLGKVTPIVQFFEKEVLRVEDGYWAGLSRLCHTFATASDVFAEKWLLWNNKSNNPESQPEFLNKYSEPIRLM